MPRTFPDYESTGLLQNSQVASGPTGTEGIGAALASIGRSVDQGLFTAVRENQQEAAYRASQRGPAAIYRDDAGVLRAETLPAPDSAENRAFLQSAQQSYLTQSELSARGKAEELRAKYPEDPAGFDREWRDYTATNLAGAPQEWLPHTRQIFDSIGSQNLSGVAVAVQRKQNANEKTGWDSLLKAQSAELVGLAEQGQAGDPRYHELLAKYDQGLKLGVARGWLDPQTEELMREQQVTEGKAAGVAGQLVAEMRNQVASGKTRTEAYQYGLGRLDAIMSDPAFAKLTPREREAIRDRTDERWREWTAVSKADTSALDKEVDAIGQGVMRGLKTPTPRLGEIERQYRALGEPEKAAEARALAERGHLVEEYAKLPIEEQQRRLDAIQAGVATPESVKVEAALRASLNRSEADSRAEIANIKQDLQAISTGQQIGMAADQLSAIEQRATRLRELGQKELADDLLRNVNAARVAQQSEQGSVVSLQRDVAESLRRNPTPENVAIAKMQQQALNEKVRALGDDALTYESNLRPDSVGPLDTLDFGQIGSPQFVDALKKRSRQADIASASEGGYPVPALAKHEIETLKRVIDVGNADQKAATAAALFDGLGADGLANVTPQLLKGKSAEQRSFGIAAEIAATNRDVARGIFIGQDIMAGRGGEKVSVMPKTEDLVKKYQSELYPVYDPFGSSDPTEMQTRGDMSAVMDRYQATTDAATAYYAYLARGVESPSFDSTADEAIRAVTGGVIDGPNTGKIIAPRGVSQSDFNRLWSSLTAEDFGTIAPTATGERVTVDQIKDNARLVSVGPDTYEVFIGQNKLYRDAEWRVPVQIELRDTTPRRGELKGLGTVRPAATSDWQRFDAFVRRNSGLAQPAIDELMKRATSLTIPDGPFFREGR